VLSLYSDHDEPATRARASFSSFGRMRMRRAVNSVARVNWWNGNGHGWTTTVLEEDSSVLEAREDEYGGMVVDADSLPHDVAAFARSLTVSLSYWKSVVRHHGRITSPVVKAKFHTC